MRKRSKYLVLSVIGAVILIILTQSLNYFLSISSFKRNAESALLSRYQIYIEEAVESIETGLSFGKPMSQFSGMEEIISVAIENYGDDGLEVLHVTDSNGQVLYSSNEDAESLFSNVQIPVEGTHVRNYENSYLIAIPVFYNAENLVGSVQGEFSLVLINERVEAMGDKILMYMAVGIFVILIVLVLSLLGLEKTAGKGNAPVGPLKVKRSTFVLITVLLFSLGIFGYINSALFQNELQSMFSNSVQEFGRAEEARIEEALEYGIPLDSLVRVETILQSQIQNIEVCDSVTITNNAGSILYYMDNQTALSVTENSGGVIGSQYSEIGENSIVIELNDGAETEGFMFLEINNELVQSQLFELVKDMVTIIIVCVVFSFEVLLLLTMFLTKSPGPETEVKGIQNIQAEYGLRIIRITSFLFYLGAFMPMAFLPMFIDSVTSARTAVPFFNIPSETILTLPISSFMLGSMIFVPLVGLLSKRITMNKLLILNGVIYLAGAFWSAFADANLTLTLARFICGLGFGGTMMSIVSLVMQFTTSKNRATGFGVYTAASASAGFCAIAIGGLFAGRFGYKAAMLITAIISTLYLVFILFLQFTEERKKLNAVEKSEGVDSWKDFFIVFRNRKLFATLFFSTLPYQLIVVGLFQYLFPLYMTEQGISAGDIGRLLTIFSITGLLIPAASRISDRTGRRKVFIVIGNIITGLGLFVFIFYDNLFAFAAVITIVGFGTILVDAVTEAIVTGVKEAELLGETKMLSIFTMYSKILAVIIPIAVGVLVAVMGNSNTIITIGVITLISTVLFLLFTIGKPDRRPEAAGGE
ncbi:MAG: MFS transporter [Spirochaetia bacterium]